MVFDDEKILRQVSVCWSNRCQMILCDLASAGNFHTDLIDNSVCLNWTMSDTKSLKWTRFPDHGQSPYQVHDLKPQTQSLPDAELILNDLEYLWATVTWFWIAKNQIRPKINVVPNDMADWLDMPWPLPAGFNLEQQIAKIVYTEYAFAEATQKMQHLLSTYEYSDFSQVNLRIHRAQRR